jgi:hypothetical protein
LLIGLFSLWVIAACVDCVVISHFPTWVTNAIRASDGIFVPVWFWCCVCPPVIHFTACGADFGGFVVCVSRAAHYLKLLHNFSFDKGIRQIKRNCE